MNGANVTRVAGADSGILAQSAGLNGNDFDHIDWTNLIDFDPQEFNNSNNDENANDGPTPEVTAEVENGGRGFESTGFAQMAGASTHTTQLRALTRLFYIVHNQ